MVAIGLLVALFAVPRYAGNDGVAAFFTILYLANTAFFASRLVSARPRPAPRAVLLAVAVTLLFGYPLVLTWIAQQGPGRLSDGWVRTGLVALLTGLTVQLFYATAYRRVFFPAIFGQERRASRRDRRVSGAAQKQPRSDTVVDLEALRKESRR